MPNSTHSREADNLLTAYQELVEDLRDTFGSSAGLDLSREALDTTKFYVIQGLEDVREYIKQGDVQGARQFLAAWRGSYKIAIDEVRTNTRARNRIMDAVGTEDATIDDVQEALRREGVAPDLGLLLLENTYIADAIASNRQRANAFGSRNKTIANIIDRLAGQHGAAKQLWPEFIQKLDNAGMRPEEAGAGVEYMLPSGKAKTMSPDTFANRISDARKISR